jgi:hypothetical protein
MVNLSVNLNIVHTIWFTKEGNGKENGNNLNNKAFEYKINVNNNL